MTTFDELVQRLGTTEFLTRPEDMHPYTHDSSRYAPSGIPLAVAIPTSSQDISGILKWANETHTKVAVRGMGTGISGGAVSYDRGITISLHKMNAIRSVDTVNKLIAVEAGAITIDIDREAKKYGLFYPPDPASYATSSIGGNIATNAGGLRCMRYGNTKDYVRQLEVVLPTGEIIHTGGKTLKNSTGLNTMPLFIGSEGTLGIITSAMLRLIPAPANDGVSFRISFKSTWQACQAIESIKNSDLSPDVLELLDAVSVESILTHFPDLSISRGETLLIGHTYECDRASTKAIVESLTRNTGGSSFEIATDHQLLDIRRLANPALTAQGLMSSCDVAVPLDKISDLCAAIDSLSQDTQTRISIVAHAGDGNFHPTVQTKPNDPESILRAEEILKEIEKIAIGMGGVISGEHGIGALKIRSLRDQFTDDEIQLQRTIKTALDPNGILTPNRAIC